MQALLLTRRPFNRNRKAPPARASGAFLFGSLAHLMLHHVQRPVHGAPAHLAALGRGKRRLVRPVGVAGAVEQGVVVVVNLALSVGGQAHDAGLVELAKCARLVQLVE